VLGLTAIAAILFSTNVAVGTTQQHEGEQQVASDGGLTVTLNGDSFGAGDIITVSGTVQGRGVNSSVSIEVIDPESKFVERGSAPVSADNVFTYSFVVDKPEWLVAEKEMVTGNYYRIVARYFPPGDEPKIEEVELVFEYRPTTFQSTLDGFRARIPNGWVVYDMNSTDPSEQQHTRQYGAEYLAIMCPQSQAVREEGGYYCDQISSDAGVGIVFYRFIDLHTRPELAALIHENKSITTSDLINKQSNITSSYHVCRKTSYHGRHNLPVHW
jgi:hypothetical protein